MKHSVITNPILFLCTIMVFVAPSIAYADGFDSLVAGICNVVAAAQKGPVKALLVIIVLFMGVGAFFGKVNWGLVVQVVVGIAGALGALAIANIVTGGSCTEAQKSAGGGGVTPEFGLDGAAGGTTTCPTGKVADGSGGCKSAP